MSIMKIKTAKQGTTTAAEFLVWVPENLEEFYPAGREAALSFSPMEAAHRDWFDNLENGMLRDNLRAMIAVTKHDGITPGSIGKPGSAFYEVPMEGRSGPSQFFRTWVPETSGNMTPERMEEWDKYRHSRDHAEQFYAEVAALTEEIMRSPELAWKAYQHVSAIRIAANALATKQRADTQERVRLERDLCSVCGSSDRITIGEVKTRFLLPGRGEVKWEHRPAKLRSCLACWNVASIVHVNALADTECAGGATRAELVTAALAEMEG